MRSQQEVNSADCRLGLAPSGWSLSHCVVLRIGRVMLGSNFGGLRRGGCPVGFVEGVFAPYLADAAEVEGGCEQRPLGV